MRRVLVFAALAAAGCMPGVAAAPAERPTQVTDTGDGMHVSTTVQRRVFTHGVGAPVENVWGALPGVFQELGLGGTADAARRTAASQPLTFNRRVMGEPATRFFDCGRGQFGMEIAANYTIHATVQTTVNPGAEGASRLDTIVEAYARSTDGANALLAQCHSEGRLEQMIAARVRERVGASSSGS